MYKNRSKRRKQKKPTVVKKTRLYSLEIDTQFIIV